MTVLLAMFVAIVAWLSVAGVASAATLEEMDQEPMTGVPAQPPGTGVLLSVDQFDPALGVLQSVKVTLEITLEGSMSATSNETVNSSQGTLTLTLEGRLHVGDTVVCPALATAEFLKAQAISAEPIDIGPGATQEFDPVSGFGMDMDTLTNPGDFGPFTGVGSVDFRVCYLTEISALVNQGNLSLDFTANALAKVKVLYTYTPTGITIEKSTNGDDADVVTGPLVPVGDPVDWVYRVTNTGEATINDIVVDDDQPGVVVVCPGDSLAGGGAFMDCTASGVAAAGQYANIGSVTGQPVNEAGDPLGPPIGDDDPSHYFGWFSTIDIEKSTNGIDADSPTGPSIAVGGDVNWLYRVTNNGNVPINGIAVTDDHLGAVLCPMGTLAAGAFMDCAAVGVAVEGQYANLGTVTGQPVDFLDQPLGDPVMDDDPSHYIGTADCIPKKDKPKPKGYPRPHPKKHPKGTKYIKFKNVLYLVFWKGAKRYVRIDGHRYSVQSVSGKPFIKIGGRQYGVKTLKRTRKLALGTPPQLPPCPKDDKNGKPTKDDKPKYDKGKGGGKQIAPSAPPAPETQAGAVIEPIGHEHAASCLGNKRYWLKGAGKNDGAWTRVGPKGKKTRFFAAKHSYVKMLRKGSKRPYFKLAGAYILAKLNTLGGAPATAKVERSMVWAEKHFASHRAGYTNVKRALKAQSAGGAKGHVKTIKRLKKKMIRHARILRKHDGMPTCAT